MIDGNEGVLTDIRGLRAKAARLTGNDYYMTVQKLDFLAATTDLSEEAIKQALAPIAALMERAFGPEPAAETEPFPATTSAPETPPAPETQQIAERAPDAESAPVAESPSVPDSSTPEASAAALLAAGAAIAANQVAATEAVPAVEAYVNGAMPAVTETIVSVEPAESAPAEPAFAEDTTRSELADAIVIADPAAVAVTPAIAEAVIGFVESIARNETPAETEATAFANAADEADVSPVEDAVAPAAEAVTEFAAGPEAAVGDTLGEPAALVDAAPAGEAVAEEAASIISVLPVAAMANGSALGVITMSTNVAEIPAETAAVEPPAQQASTETADAAPLAEQAPIEAFPAPQALVQVSAQDLAQDLAQVSANDDAEPSSTPEAATPVEAEAFPIAPTPDASGTEVDTAQDASDATTAPAPLEVTEDLPQAAAETETAPAAEQPSIEAFPAPQGLANGDVEPATAPAEGETFPIAPTPGASGAEEGAFQAAADEAEAPAPLEVAEEQPQPQAATETPDAAPPAEQPPVDAFPAPQGLATEAAALESETAAPVPAAPETTERTAFDDLADASWRRVQEVSGVPAAEQTLATQLAELAEPADTSVEEAAPVAPQAAEALSDGGSESRSSGPVDSLAHTMETVDSAVADTEPAAEIHAVAEAEAISAAAEPAEASALIGASEDQSNTAETITALADPTEPEDVLAADEPVSAAPAEEMAEPAAGAMIEAQAASVEEPLTAEAAPAVSVEEPLAAIEPAVEAEIEVPEPVEIAAQETPDTGLAVSVEEPLAPAAIEPAVEAEIEASAPAEIAAQETPDAGLAVSVEEPLSSGAIEPAVEAEIQAPAPVEIAAQETPDAGLALSIEEPLSSAAIEPAMEAEAIAPAVATPAPMVEPDPIPRTMPRLTDAKPAVTASAATAASEASAASLAHGITDAPAKPEAVYELAAAPAEQTSIATNPAAPDTAKEQAPRRGFFGRLFGGREAAHR
jgi:hypothetical protein